MLLDCCQTAAVARLADSGQQSRERNVRENELPNVFFTRACGVPARQSGRQPSGLAWTCWAVSEKKAVDSDE